MTVTTMPSRPFTPPMRAATAITFDSPFSDYFTDTSTSPEPSSAPGNASTTQKSLLSRLRDVGRQILHKDPDAHIVTLLLENLDAVDAALTAPEPQSRQPAELVDSGLFMEEELEELAPLDEELKREFAPFLQKDTLRNLISVAHSAEELRKRFEEVKYINDLVLEKLAAATSEVEELRRNVASLRKVVDFKEKEIADLKAMAARGITRVYVEDSDDEELLFSSIPTSPTVPPAMTMGTPSDEVWVIMPREGVHKKYLQAFTAILAEDKMIGKLDYLDRPHEAGPFMWFASASQEALMKYIEDPMVMGISRISDLPTSVGEEVNALLSKNIV